MAFYQPTTRAWLVLLIVAISGCASSPPNNTSNICSMFEERRNWFKAAKKAENRWKIPVPVSMAFIEQESSFKGRAKPPRTTILWVIPGPRQSDAFGYAQALDSTWNDYKEGAGNWGARRSKFADAVDFIGWYNNNSVRQNHIARDDAYNLYLAYHEGSGGFSRGTYRNKAWLTDVARNVENTATRYETQLAGCEKRLGRNWLMRLLF